MLIDQRSSYPSSPSRRIKSIPVIQLDPSLIVKPLQQPLAPPKVPITWCGYSNSKPNHEDANKVKAQLAKEEARSIAYVQRVKQEKALLKAEHAENSRLAKKVAKRNKR